MNNTDNYNTEGKDVMVPSLDENYNSITNQNPSVATGGQTLTGFEDSAPTMTSGSSGFSLPRLGAPDAGITEFFSRPVKINSGYSNIGDFSLNPLMLYLNNPTVARKIANYRYLRATICIRYSEAAMPFVYGCRQLSLEPFSGNNNYARVFSSHDASHLQCQYTNPTTARPILMKAPFFNNSSYYDIKDVQNNIAYAWHLHNLTLFTYSRCDAATAPTTTYSIHVWLEDVELDLPSATDSVESEYRGVVSTPATAIGKAANALSSIPILKPFTQPVEEASNLIGRFARNFGFSKPIQLDPPKIFVDNPDHNMTLSTYMDVAQKLTLDPKQSITVDTQFIDGSNTDNLDFRNFFTRETLAGSFDWLTTAAVGTILTNLPVHPCIFKDEASNACTLMSCALPVLPFRYWRGGMRFRFKVISSAYHRGRLRVYWSPFQLSGVPTEDIFNQLESYVIDVESTSEAVVDINYAGREYMKKAKFRGYSDMTNHGSDSVNGYLYVRVSQELSAPLSTALARVLIFVSAHEDMEVSGKSGFNMGMFHLFKPPTSACQYRTSGLMSIPSMNPVGKTIDWEYQSLAMDSKDIMRITFNQKADYSKLHSAIVGSTVRSFRELVKAWHLWEVNTMPFAYAGRQSTYVSFPPYPLIPGGINSTPTATGGLKLYDSPMTMMSSYFKGYRGGTRWKIIFDSYLPASVQFRVALIRQPNTYQRLSGGIDEGIENSFAQPLSVWDNNAVAIQRSGNSITFEIPYEFHLSFFGMPAANAFGNGRSNAILYLFNTQSATAVNDVIGYRAYVSAAEDTSWVGYVGPGRTYFYNVFPDTVAAVTLPVEVRRNDVDGAGTVSAYKDLDKLELLADYQVSPLRE